MSFLAFIIADASVFRTISAEIVGFTGNVTLLFMRMWEVFIYRLCKSVDTNFHFLNYRFVWKYVYFFQNLKFYEFSGEKSEFPIPLWILYWFWKIVIHIWEKKNFFLKNLNRKLFYSIRTEVEVPSGDRNRNLYPTTPNTIEII